MRGELAVTYWFLCQRQEGVLQSVAVQAHKEEHPLVTASCDDFEFTYGL